MIGSENCPSYNQLECAANIVEVLLTARTNLRDAKFCKLGNREMIAFRSPGECMDYLSRDIMDQILFNTNERYMDQYIDRPKITGRVLYLSK